MVAHVAAAVAVRQGDEPEDERGGDQTVEYAVESGPEIDDGKPGFPDLGDLVKHVPQCKGVEETLDNVELPAGVDAVHRQRVQHQVGEADQHLRPVLVHGGAHAVRVEMGPEARVVLVVVLDECRRVVLVLHQPAAPQVVDAFLVARAADDPKRVQVDCLFDHVGGLGRFVVDDDRVAFQ